MISKILIILLICINEYHCDFILKWHDEFNGMKLDENKWSVTDGPDYNDASETEEVLSSSQNSDKNIKLIDGVLAITVVQENVLDRNFTAATINSKMAFLYGRVDVRAALPKGAQLKTAILLLPEANDFGKNSSSGEIEIVADLQRQERWDLAEYFLRASYHGEFGEIVGMPASDGFEEYSLEWNETAITWYRNGMVKSQFDLDRILNDFYKLTGEPFDRKFYITLRLQVFNFRDDVFVVNEQVHRMWDCPSFLIDYVRLYQEDYSRNILKIDEEPMEASNCTKESVCKIINQSLRQFYKYEDPGYLKRMILWIVVGIISLIIFMSILVIYLVKRKPGTPIQLEHQDNPDFVYEKPEKNCDYSEPYYDQARYNYVTHQSHLNLQEDENNYLQIL